MDARGREEKCTFYAWAERKFSSTSFLPEFNFDGGFFPSRSYFAKESDFLDILASLRLPYLPCTPHLLDCRYDVSGVSLSCLLFLPIDLQVRKDSFFGVSQAEPCTDENRTSVVHARKIFLRDSSQLDIWTVRTTISERSVRDKNPIEAERDRSEAAEKRGCGRPPPTWSSGSEIESTTLSSKKTSTTPNECPHPGGTEVHAVRESPLSISEQVCRLRLPRTCDLTAGG